MRSAIGRGLSIRTKSMGDGRRSRLDEVDGTRAPIAWLACLANAVPLAMVLIWLVNWLVAPVSAAAGLGLYAAVFAALVPALKPWRDR
jgi:hypothetical protein